ncbi:DUF4249 domain-containing protein [Galbibacter mesophilus]|uniref:DUF4249 domain-containing protein n=1 Tax=Galbibacter mesophilus TaxID=379069 RepID=UPI0019201D33|nr:DUF4249 domain-containing protein [Galbibacter mesophilus]MCM5661410.1 DUF4249 domain-containing protein [Galbibacter mesophilus]
MKKVIIGILTVFLFLSCEEVIDVDLETAPPRLVVEASINWVNQTNGTNQQIRLTQTAPYFDTEVPPANNAEVFILNEAGDRFDFIEDGNSGFYICTDFEPVIGSTYFLTVIYEGETYTAEETMLPVPSFEYVTQSDGEVFSEEFIELKAFFQDPPNEENYYFYTFDAENDNTIDVIEDRLVDGNEIFAFFASEELSVGEDVEISLYGVSKRYFSFMSTLLDQTGTDGGGPFETQPATVRGNIINQTNFDNFAFGYFRLSQTDRYTYTIE